MSRKYSGKRIFSKVDHVRVINYKPDRGKNKGYVGLQGGVKQRLKGLQGGVDNKGWVGLKTGCVG